MNLNRGTQGKAVLMSLLLICAGGCAQLQSPSIFPEPAKSYGASENNMQSDAAQFVARLATERAKTGPIDAKKLAQSGMSLSNQVCEVFFNELDDRRRKSDFYKDSYVATGTGITTVLATTQSHARSIVNITALLSGSSTIFESFRANFVFTPELKKVHKHIAEAQDRAWSETMSAIDSSGISTFEEVKKVLVAYDQLCSIKNIIYVINESVSVARFTSQDEPTLDPTKDNKDLAARLNTILYAKAGGARKPGVFTEEEMKSLYLAITMRDKKNVYQVLTDGTGESKALSDEIKRAMTALGYDFTKCTADKACGVDADAIFLTDSIGRLLNLDARLKEISAKVLEEAKSLDGKAAPPAGAAALPTEFDFKVLLKSQQKSLESGKLPQVRMYAVQPSGRS